MFVALDEIGKIPAVLEQYSNSSGDIGGASRMWNRAMARKNASPVMRMVAGNTAASASIRLTVTLLR
jgi:hypothetical protein